MTDATVEISAGQRFSFGDNWSQFLTILDDERIAAAIASLRSMLAVNDLGGLRCIDVGSGSGLFSLAARKLGAEVVSFDNDPASVACTAELRSRYFPADSSWQVCQGSVLDRQFVESLGQFDVVYSWGALHHTGDMWTALGNVVRLVKPGGRLFISVYNDQGFQSRAWSRVKRQYNSSGPVGRWLLLNGTDIFFRLRALAPLQWAYRTVRRLPAPAATPRGRGMDRRHDLIDWVGGYPFEVAKPEQIFEFYRKRDFTLERLKTCGGGLGCNEFVFRRS